MIHAIETRYAGYRFRSRLEARWAVFFDVCGLRWQYEIEAFHLPSGNYLPDFWLHDEDCWVEVKGGDPTPRASSLARELEDVTGKRCLFLHGDISEYRDSADLREAIWMECEICKRIQLCMELDDWYALPCGCHSGSYGDQRLTRTPRLLTAYAAALSARFDGADMPRASAAPVSNDPIALLAHAMSENDRRARRKDGM